MQSYARSVLTYVLSSLILYLIMILPMMPSAWAKTDILEYLVEFSDYGPEGETLSCQGLISSYGLIFPASCSNKLKKALTQNRSLTLLNGYQAPSLSLTSKAQIKPMSSTHFLLVTDSPGTVPSVLPDINFWKAGISYGSSVIVSGLSNRVATQTMTAVDGRNSQNNFHLTTHQKPGSVANYQGQPFCLVAGSHSSCVPFQKIFDEAAKVSKGQTVHGECPTMKHIQCNQLKMDPSTCDGEGNGSGSCVHNNSTCVVYLNSRSTPPIAQVYEQVSCDPCTTLYEVVNGYVGYGYFNENTGSTPNPDLPPPSCYAPLIMN